LITDSNGDRVLEVDRSGDVVWTATVGFPYEAERLGTGDESAGGDSADALGLPTRTVDEDDSLTALVETALPPTVVNAVAYLLPRWVGVVEAAATVSLVVSVLGWTALEHRWTGVSITDRVPVRFERK
ncbi:MAG: arylsulfotransferase (asst), partial [Halobacteriota archaeon]